MDQSARAEAAFQECKKLIREEADAKESGKKTRERIGKILKAIQQVVAVVEGVAELHPAAKMAVSVFKALISLEVARRDNNEQIIVVYYNMTRVFYTLQEIPADIRNDDQRFQQLETEINDLLRDMKEFGDFVDVFNTKYKSRLVRFLLAGALREELKKHIGSFENHRQQLVLMFAAQTAVTVRAVQDDVQELLTSNERILARLGERASKAEKAAGVRLDALGLETVCNDRGALDDVASALSEGTTTKEPITSTTLEALRTPLEDLLEQNRVSFEAKLDRAEATIVESINQSRKEIMEQLTGGPHELLKDPDVRAVWEVNKWKLGVKCRQFVDSVYTHFDAKFRERALDSGITGEVEDAWTLNVLSRVINHPAIGEAIDEDASGFLSIQEVNNFLTKRPEKYSTPQWLVFWAIGWRYMNSWYTVEIYNMIHEIKSQCKALASAKDSAENLKESVSEYLETLKLLKTVTDWNDYADADEDGILADCDDDTSTRVEDLARQLATEYEGRMRLKLEACKYNLDDGTELRNIAQDMGARIEQIFIPLLYTTVVHHRDIIKKAPESIAANVDDFTAALVQMDDTLFDLLFAFHERMQSLLRSWRSQKLDNELQVQCYAGGLMYSWYRKVQEAPTDIEDFFYSGDDEEGEEDGNGDGESDGDSSSGEEDDEDDIPLSLSASVTQLHRKVKGLEKKLAEMRSMIQQLLGASQPGGQAHAAAGDTQAAAPGAQARVGAAPDSPGGDSPGPVRESRDGGIEDE